MRCAISISRPRRSLFFLHIRKTAGSSIRSILSQQFAISDMLLDWHERQNCERDPSPFGLVTGHGTFDDVRRFTNRPLILTFLRDPLERALSAFYYYRGHSAEEMNYFERTMPRGLLEQRARFKARAGELGLRRFLQEEEELARLWLYNVQTRVLAGATDGEPQPLPDDLLLEAAGRNLADCDVIGLTDRMDDSLRLIGRRLAWEHSVVERRENRTRDRPTREAVAPEAIERLIDWNRLDRALYEQALLLFERQLQQDSNSQPALPPSAVEYPPARDYRFDQPIVGRGWHAREYFQNRWICWTGAQREATLELQIESPGPHRLECRLEHVLAPSILNDLKIFLGSHQLAWELQTREQERWLCAPVPARWIPDRTHPVRLRFQVRDPLRPSDFNPAANDHRLLGIALSHIRLQPDEYQFFQR